MAKYEGRGKYGGIKVHFDGPECQAYLDWRNGDRSPEQAAQFANSIAKHIAKLLAEHPDLLQDRPAEKVLEALEKDKAKIEKQLAALTHGQDWKQVA
jgi:hypothetical protein